MGLYYGICVFLQSFSTKIHGSAFQTKRPHVMLWYGLFFINSYPFVVVKYLYIVLKHFGRSLMLSSSILFSSPEQSLRRAIVLPPASALALALALASASTNVKVLR